VAGESALGVHFALSLAAAVEDRVVPESASGEQLVRHVHLHVGQLAFHRLKGSCCKLEKRAINDKGGILTLHEDLETPVSKSALVVLVALPSEALEFAKGIGKHIVSNSVFMTIQSGPSFPAEVEMELNKVFKEKSILYLPGTATYSCNFRKGDDACCATSLGSILMTRLPRKKEQQMMYLQALEAARIPVVYGSGKYKVNWLYGELIWRSFETYSAIAFGEDNPLSLYQQLESGLEHRMIFLALIEEGLGVLSDTEVRNVTSEGSPLGSGFWFAENFLLKLPNPLFGLVLRVLLASSLQGLPSRVKNGAAYGSKTSLQSAAFVNGTIVSKGPTGKTPLNAALQQAALKKIQRAAFQIPTVTEEGAYPLWIATLVVFVSFLTASIAVLSFPFILVLAVNFLLADELKFL